MSRGYKGGGISTLLSLLGLSRAVRVTVRYIKKGLKMNTIDLLGLFRLLWCMKTGDCGKSATNAYPDQGAYKGSECLSEYKGLRSE